jgi:hypothetical protein
MGFFSFIVLLAIAYLVWRVTDQLPDLIFRLSEIQRDVAEIRRRVVEPTRESEAAPAPAATAAAPLGEETGADYTGR